MAFFGLSSRNDEQKQAMRILANNKPYCFITGPAGTGKSVTTVAVGAHRVVETKEYRRMIFTRLQSQLGVNLGALPGDLSEKTDPFMRPFFDSWDVFSNRGALQYLMSGDESKRKIILDNIQTMRGASIADSYIVIDEAENLDVHTIAGIATRLAQGSKMIFLGNFAQIDEGRLRNPEKNGLYRLLSGMYEEEAYQYFDHINLTTIERHPAIAVVEKILRDHEMDSKFEELEKRGNINQF